MAQLGDYGLEITGKKALITGGGRGLGKDMALTLAKAGADIAITARTESQLIEAAEEIRALGRVALPIRCDVSIKKEVDSAVDKAIEGLGWIDVLISNAGVQQIKKTLEISEEEWLKTMDINVNGTFYMVSAVGKHMISRKKGKIIIVSSVTGLRGGPGTCLHYSTSKGALVAMTRALAMEWARHNINVNGIAPGTFKTDMTAARHDDPEIEKKYLKTIPLRWVPGPEAISPLALYLASDASNYMTGEVVVIDGGMTQHF